MAAAIARAQTGRRCRWCRLPLVRILYAATLGGRPGWRPGPVICDRCDRCDQP